MVMPVDAELKVLPGFKEVARKEEMILLAAFACDGKPIKLVDVLRLNFERVVHFGMVIFISQRRSAILVSQRMQTT